MPNLHIASIRLGKEELQTSWLRGWFIARKQKKKGNMFLTIIDIFLFNRVHLVHPRMHFKTSIRIEREQNFENEICKQAYFVSHLYLENTHDYN